MPELVEVWNLVFMEWERLPDGSFKRLPQQSVDTGMGLERLVAILQGCTSNFDSELFAPLMEQLHGEGASIGLPPYGGRFGVADSNGLDRAYRIVADHCRMATVAACDGLLPGHTDLSSKLRNVINRATLYASKVLRLPRPGVLARLSPLVVHSLVAAYPELSAQATAAAAALQADEEHFLTATLPFLESVLEECRRSAVDPFFVRPHELRFVVEGHAGNKPVSRDLLQCLAEIEGVTLDFSGAPENPSLSVTSSSRFCGKSAEATR